MKLKEFLEKHCEEKLDAIFAFPQEGEVEYAELELKGACVCFDVSRDYFSLKCEGISWTPLRFSEILEVVERNENSIEVKYSDGEKTFFICLKSIS